MSEPARLSPEPPPSPGAGAAAEGVRHRKLPFADRALTIMLFVLVVASMPMPVAYATAKGEMRRVPLIDGSTLTLNTESRVDVYEEERRLRVRIRRGEVFLESSGSG